MKALLHALLYFSCLTAGSAWAADCAPLTADMPATGIGSVMVTASTGEMQITPSTDDKVHVRLALEQQEHNFLWLYYWLSNDTSRDLKGAVLKTERHGDGLSLSLIYPSGGMHNDVQEKWTVSLPGKLLVDAEMQDGEIIITGMHGGVKAHLDAGETVIQDNVGDVQAGVTYGRLHVISNSTKPGILTLTSGHGLAVMDWNGKYYGPPEEHGFMSHVHFFGNSLVERGGGTDNMDLNVHYGEVDLRIGALGDVQDYRDAFTAK
jgi:hypothetical protein